MKAQGLGDRFLGHVERCRVILHLVDGTGEDVGRRLPDGARASSTPMATGCGEARDRRPVEVRYGRSGRG